MSRVQSQGFSEEEIHAERLQALLGFNIKMAFSKLQQSINSVLVQYKLRRASYACLVLIVDNPGIAPTQLAKFLSIDKPNMTNIVSDLKNNRYIQTHKLEKDKRKYALHATKLGVGICHKATLENSAYERKAFAAFSNFEKKQLIMLLDKITPP